MKTWRNSAMPHTYNEDHPVERHMIDGAALKTRGWVAFHMASYGND
jgi:hypothetical protein